MLIKVDFAPGFVKDDSPLQAEGTWIDGDKVRFRRGRPQTIGGWELQSGDAWTGIARGMHAWGDLLGQPLLAWGTAANLYVDNGGAVEDITPTGLPAGLVDGLGGLGYGSGAYGEGTYSLPSTTDYLPRVWAVGNFGEDLLALPLDGGLYSWTPSRENANLLVNGDFSSNTGWTEGTGWSIASDKATATAGTGSDLSRSITLTDGEPYIAQVTVDMTAGEVELYNDTAQIGDTITESGTYIFTFTANSSGSFKFTKDAAFEGELTDATVIPARALAVANAPTRAQWMFVTPERHVVLLGTEDAGGTYSPMTVRWSGQDDKTEWTPADDNQAGDIPLGSGTRLISGLPTRGQNVLWTDTSLYTMRYLESDPFFTFDLVGTGCGIIGPKAAAEKDGVVFWMGQRQFYAFVGQTVQVIDCPVRRDVFDNLTSGQEYKVCAGINSQFNEVWWFYPDRRDGEECSRYVAYNWIEKVWFTGTFARSAWVDAGVYPSPIAAATDSKMYFHERGTSGDGGALGAYIESAYFDIRDGETWLAILGAVPDFEDQVGNITLTLSGRGYPNGPEFTADPMTITTSTQRVFTRFTARQIKLRLESANFPSFWRLGAFRLDTVETGQRR